MDGPSTQHCLQIKHFNFFFLFCMFLNLKCCFISLPETLMGKVNRSGIRHLACYWLSEQFNLSPLSMMLVWGFLWMFFIRFGEVLILQCSLLIILLGMVIEFGQVLSFAGMMVGLLPLVCLYVYFVNKVLHSLDNFLSMFFYI